MGTENEQEQPHPATEGTEHVAVRNLETQKRRRKAVGCLLQVFALQLMLFGLLAWYVHFNPIVPLDVAITHSFQQNQALWLRITMLAISYPGSSPLLPVLVILTTFVFWALGVRLEAVFVSCVSSTQRTRRAADAKGTRTHEAKEDIALISDKRMVRKSGG